MEHSLKIDRRPTPKTICAIGGDVEEYNFFRGEYHLEAALEQFLTVGYSPTMAVFLQGIKIWWLWLAWDG